ncbi:MAG: DNA-binding protein [Caldiserica bacterium]|nr:MAG: DNA-binding protein [Caldisericota bacterium]
MRRLVKEWIKLAEDDLKTAELLFKEKIYNYACFHSQQCVEKIMKALIERKHRVPKIHHLLELLESCKKEGYKLEYLRKDLSFLDKFYTLTRYPFIPGIVRGRIPTQKDAEKAINIAKKVYKICLNLLMKEV